MNSLDSRLPLRFWNKCTLDPASGCWLWTGGMNGTGYGRVKLNKRMQYPHRVAYEAMVGAVPAGLQLDHLCRNRSCCNPAHLEAVTASENMKRARSVVKPVSRCIAGHEFVPENTYLTPDGRRCKACHRRRERERSRRKSIVEQAA